MVAAGTAFIRLSRLCPGIVASSRGCVRHIARRFLM
jgi:hypothetical protein